MKYKIQSDDGFGLIKITNCFIKNSKLLYLVIFYWRYLSLTERVFFLEKTIYIV